MTVPETAARRGGEARAFLPAAVVLAVTGLSLRSLGAAFFHWQVTEPALVRHCLAGVAIHAAALVLARRRRADLAILVSGLDYGAIASLTPRIGIASEVYLYALIHPFLALAFSRWSPAVRAFLAVLPPAIFIAVRVGGRVPPSTELLSSDQLWYLATCNAVVFVGLCA